jgi:CMP-N,N'-diacetyllegionaminic acid synthase
MIRNQSIIAVIPARAGSKGIPNKNLSKVGERSLVEWAIWSSLNSAKIKFTIVTSDSLEILNHGRRFVETHLAEKANDIYFHNRRLELATDKSMIIATLKEIVSLFGLTTENCNGVLLMQPTSPFRKQGEVDEFLKFAYRNEKYCPTVSVKEVEDSHPARMYRMNANQELAHISVFREEEFLPRQELTKLYLRDGAYYLMSVDMIQRGSPVKAESLGYIRKYPYNINIDSQSDLDLAKSEFSRISDEL